MSESASACTVHPLGLRPLGNALVDDGACNLRDTSLGPLFSLLSDEILVALLGYCGAGELNSLALCSRALYAFTRDDELWRRLTLAKFGSNFRFAESWRRTFVRSGGRNTCDIHMSCSDKCRADESSRPQKRLCITNLPEELLKSTLIPPRIVQVTGIFSDVLFHKWRCQSAAISPSWLIHDNIQRIDVQQVSVEEFRENFEKPGVPVVIRGIVRNWQAWKKWSKDDFSERFGDVPFVAGGYDFPMKRYIDYADAVVGNCDQPLYLFDKDFASKAPQLAEEYRIPKYFEEDLFKHIGDEEERPSYRWLIVGPKNSGSSFHKDPNATSAWNACVVGSKKWILFPPKVPPPGVHPNRNESDVTAPVSVLEWFMNFYDAAREVSRDIRAVECTVKAGETLFIPAGWWHTVLNLEWTVAITQNYVSSVNFERVAKWLESRPSQVSGCRDEAHARRIAANFVPRVLKARPDLREAVLGPGKDNSQNAGKNRLKQANIAQGLWSKLTTKDNHKSQNSHFTFGLE